MVGKQQVVMITGASGGIGRAVARRFTDEHARIGVMARSMVRISMIQLPGMNTTQFTWGRTKLPKQTMPVPPIYQPEDRRAHGPFDAPAHAHSAQYELAGHRGILLAGAAAAALSGGALIACEAR